MVLRMGLSTTGDRIGFIGAGQMARALARAWISYGLLAPENCRAFDPLPDALTHFENQTAGQGCDFPTLVNQSDILILAVKPQNVPSVLASLSERISQNHLVISIAAGVTLQQLTEGLKGSGSGPVRLARVMPNTPCLVGCSASGYTLGAGALPEDGEVVQKLFAAVGKAFLLPEHLLDAVTGLSGSGPAYVYVMIEALADGGVRMGLPRDVSLTLAAQTVLGASRMVLETGQHPAVLKDVVASPAGTTIAGLHALEKGGLRAALMDAVCAATLRARELGQKGSS